MLTVEEVARQLRVSPKTVWAWLGQGRLPGFKLTPKVWRIRREELSHLVDRVVEQVMERLAERITTMPPNQAARSERPERFERSTPAIAAPKAAVLQRLRAMQGEGLSLQAMANQLNAEGMPTLRGKGHWQKWTIGNLLTQKDH